MNTPIDADYIAQPPLYADFGKFGRVCRLGLATRGNTHLDPEAVCDAVRRGVNYLNWCGYADGMSRAVRQMGDRRRDVFVATQLNARSKKSASRELDQLLGELGTDYLDVVTYYYVEHDDEWEEIISPGGAAEAIEQARANGRVKAIGLTSHQRPLAARVAKSGRLDMLMIRYNAAHRGAEQQVFPTTLSLAMPVVTYTGLRWGALLNKTPDDPAGYVPPKAPDWYRFVLCHPGVTIGIMAPDGSDELEEDLSLIDNWHGFSPDEYRALTEHGDRVHRHGGSFP